MSTAELAVARSLPMPKMPRTWKFFGTALWTVAALAAMSIAQLVVMLLAFAFLVKGEFDEGVFAAFVQHGGVVAGSVLVGVPAALLVLWLATRTAGRSFASYLALRRPTLRQIAYALAASAALLSILDGSAWLLGYPLSPDFSLASVRTARDSGLIWLLMLGFCVGAPIAEEFIFRGFLFRGWSTSFLGPLGAIVLSGVLFAVIHPQYEWFYIAGIAMVGWLFGYLRHWSGSTWLTVITHAFYNLMAGVQALWLVS
jgi:membrane protease YdiL (CAAX protease family)